MGEKKPVVLKQLKALPAKRLERALAERDADIDATSVSDEETRPEPEDELLTYT